MKWSAFSSASEQLIAIGGETASLAKVIEQSQRFYASGCRDFLIGKQFDADLVDLIELPFDRISILHEVKCESIDGSTSDRPVITVAVKYPYESTWCAIYDFVCYDGSWTIGAPPVSVKKDHDKFVLELLDSEFAQRVIAMFPGISRESMTLEAEASFQAVASLCAMLSLSNVKAEKVDVPKKLNHKRERSGKLPLWSYHVLNVGGEVWSNKASSSNEAGGIRSHLRRGHVRRLSDGRRVWVRAAFVKGSEPGFVSKDYEARK